MARYYVDLHIHIGSTLNNESVKITASRNLNILQIAEESLQVKGIDLIGIVDCGSPPVRADLYDLLEKGILKELKNGGLRYKDSLTIIPGVEVESLEKNGGRGHFISYFSNLAQLEEYGEFLGTTIKNITLSTQQSYLTAKELLKKTNQLAGLFCPAHAFTPYRSLFGSCGDSLKDVFGEDAKEIKVIELGLSADTQMADKIAELRDITYITNSDAHSLGNIGREYMEMELWEPSFEGLQNALNNVKGRIIAYYGLNPQLGKYHRNYCGNCGKTIEALDSSGKCLICSSSKTVKGVVDRIGEISSPENSYLPTRPPYYYHVPLSFLPKIGPKTIAKLLNGFGTEMNVIHKADFADIEKIAGQQVADIILKARKGQLEIISGGGGVVGKISEQRSNNYL